ncbi:MAG: DUF2612 domain-containing protein [Synergistaceae bacterium]|nr:DUF2612 domain-containing protein [Synergistaceae bacterium]
MADEKILQARIEITPGASVLWPLLWDNPAAFWDVNPWQLWEWTERFKPTFASRSKMTAAEWLHWDNSATFWDHQRWKPNWLKGRFETRWNFINGKLYLEIWLKLADTILPPKSRPTRWTVNGDLSYEIYKPYKKERYMALPTWEHRRPKFLAVLEHIVTPVVDMENQAYILATREYNVNTAAGEELDRIGEWVGISREVYPPLDGVYFTWDDRKTNGWDMGIWRGPDDPPTGLARLPDEPYRWLIKAKIAANHWDGTVDNAYQVWDTAFNGEIKLVIIDNQDMSMDMIIIAEEDDTILRAILRDEKLPLRPTGVKVNYELVIGGPILMWDRDATPATGVWDTGKFAK